MTKQDLSDLLVRVEGATGPDRELDNALTLALTGAERIAERPDCQSDYAIGAGGGSPVQPLTASVEAALNMVAWKLPDAYRDLGEGYDTKAERRYWIATLTYHTHGKGSHSAEACSASLALLAAMLKALIEDGSARSPLGYDAASGTSASSAEVDGGGK